MEARKIHLWKVDYLLGSSIAAVIVAIEEISQIFVRGRAFDWNDLVFDFLGIFLFGEFARIICRPKAAS